jgi:hypothetical protein
VVGSRVDGVGSDHIGAELLQQGDITLAVGLTGEGVDEGCVTRGAGGAGLANILLVRNTLDEELGAVGVEELGALHVEKWSISGCSRDIDFQRLIVFWVPFSTICSAKRMIVGVLETKKWLTLAVMAGRSAPMALLARASRETESLDKPIFADVNDVFGVLKFICCR